jgi:hypothetical protein
MADLSVTIGLDQKELEKGLADAGKSIGNMGKGGAGGGMKNPFQAVASQFGTAQGIGSFIGGPIGGMIGALVDAFGGAIRAMIDKVKELADYAQRLRLASIKTGLGMDEIRQLEAIGQAFGVSLQTMTGSVVEFTRRMGEARIKGGEVTNILAKMGVGMDEISDGSFNATDAMKALADSYAAGTDEATLLYYGTKMFGDSFKELLPIIKAGSRAVEDAASSYIEGEEKTTAAAGRLKNDLDNIGRSIKNFLVSLLGAVVLLGESIQAFFRSMNPMNLFKKLNPFESLDSKVAREIENAPKYMTNKEITEWVVGQLPFANEKEVREAVEKALKGDGKKLSPFGMADAGAASQMQQMAGGDIFGAVSFTPLERIATATEETARNTAPQDTTPPRTPDEVTR